MTVAERALPPPRGPLTERLFGSLHLPPHDLGPVDGPGEEEDLHLALYCCYEMHYGGLGGVDAEWEWEPSLLALRRDLEHEFLDDLLRSAGPVPSPDPADVSGRLWEVARAPGGPSLSAWVEEHAGLGQVRELAIHRSAYQLKEADPHTWGIPRVAGHAKAVMVAIQADEYGSGSGAEMHSSLFAQTMRALGLDTTPNRYLDLIPAATLAPTNLISMFGLHRRWRGALLGHLALFEMTSIGPMARYARAMRRLGLPGEACRFYDVHVEADRVHQHLAADSMIGALMEDEPGLAGDVLFGAAALTEVEGRFTRHLLASWASGRTSLLGLVGAQAA